MRPIDADALKNGGYELQRTYRKDASTMVYEVKKLDDIPTIEAEPVKHGRWIAMSDADGVYWACSECGEDIPRISHYNPQFDLFPRLESIDKTNYCPNCGAKMEK